MKIIISKKNFEVQKVIPVEVKHKKILLLGGSDCDLDTALEYHISIEFNEDMYRVIFIDAINNEKVKREGPFKKWLNTAALFSLNDCSLYFNPNTTNEVFYGENTSLKDWNYEALPTNPEDPNYVRRLLNFLKEICETDQIAIFHHDNERLTVLAQEGMQIKNQAEELIYQFIKDQSETIIQINSNTHTMLFNAGLNPSDFTIIRQKIEKDSEVLLYLPSAPLQMVRPGQLKTFFQLCAQSLALYLSFKSKKESSSINTKPGDFFWGKTLHMRRVKEVIDKTVLTNLNLLIKGEVGVGKGEVVDYCCRKSKLNLVDVSLKGMSLIDQSTFFFGKRSLLKQVEGKVLYLQDVDCLNIQIQKKLVPVLLTQKNIRIFSSMEASNVFKDKDLFDPEFAFLIGEVEVQIPTLRERCQDIEALANIYLEEFIQANNFNRKLFSIDALKELERQEWKGNLSELRSFVRRLAVFSSKRLISFVDVKSILAGRELNKVNALAGFSWNLKEAKDQFQVFQIQRALALCKQNRTSAAELLGISPRTLYRLIADSDKTDSATDENVTP